ncbi:ATP-binding cassette domain-containing protein [Chitinophaga sp. Cy-1792]|uniref:ATP-binding cassette domain-containing protein n=1 Tax=Chitinophaga sp. Cy-1792 TaxID=2608339 RepID=UPI0014205527|nr:ATP-binding cassette domain-containing protein [Chitinophaga sp. Cy-1792]NIG53008.1 ATP-binding cassette domain-containing protein [Chitinophaga sp. Cy-1792]
MPVHILRADSIIKNYGKRTLLRDCQLSCKTGEVVGLLGRNGCGKSTLLKIIFGTCDALNRYVSIDEEALPTPYATGKNLAYLPQEGFLPTNITVGEIIDVYLEDISAANQVKAHPRVAPHLELRRDELSGGTLRILEILLVIHLDVKFVLLDEPFNGVEPIYVDEIIGLLESYRDNKGFIITDHNYMDIIRASDKIILLSDGICRSIKDTSELEKYDYVPLGTFDQP